MALINLNQNITNVIPVTGEGNVSYTCPQDKRAFVTITMVLSIVKWSVDLNSTFLNGIPQHINRSFTFNLEIKGGDIIVFSESGEGSSTVNSTISTTFVINGSTTITRSLSFTNTSSFPIQTSVMFSANIFYSSIEYAA